MDNTLREVLTKASAPFNPYLGKGTVQFQLLIQLLVLGSLDHRQLG